MPKDFLQGASLKPTFIQHFECGELHIFHIRFNIVKKHPLQNRTSVQIKGGGVKGLLNNVQKNFTFLTRRLPLFIYLFRDPLARGLPSVAPARLTFLDATVLGITLVVAAIPTR